MALSRIVVSINTGAWLKALNNRLLFHNVSRLGLINVTEMSENINYFKWQLSVKMWCWLTPVHEWKCSTIALHPLCMYGARLERMCILKFERNTNTVLYDRSRCNWWCWLTPMYFKNEIMSCKVQGLPRLGLIRSSKFGLNNNQILHDGFL